MEGRRRYNKLDNQITTYVLELNKIVKEIKPGHTVFYHYDQEAMLTGFNYNGNEYFYIRSLTGNIEKINDNEGIIKVEYKYDAWGCVPKWLKWAGLAVGAVLVTAAVVALTVGTAGLGGGLAAGIVIGAAKGTLIGAGVGVVAGGVIGGATSDWSLVGIVEGAMIGFGAGAVIGAVIGGVSGGVSFSKAASAWNGGKEKMVSHFMDHGVKNGYKNPVKYTKDGLKVTKNGNFIAQKNAYVSLSRIGSTGKNVYNYVGISGQTGKITTYFYKTFTKTAAKLIGLL